MSEVAEDVKVAGATGGVNTKTAAVSTTPRDAIIMIAVTLLTALVFLGITLFFTQSKGFFISYKSDSSSRPAIFLTR